MSDGTQKTSADALPGDDWATRLTKQVARTVNYYRKEMGLTTKALAILCTVAARDTENPRAVKATTLNNLFAGKRKSIGLDEVILFARVLGVPPIALMVPVGFEGQSDAWPGSRRNSMTAFDALVGATRWGSIFDDVLAWLPDAGEHEAATEYSEIFGVRRSAAAARAHEVTRLSLKHGRLQSEISERVLLFHSDVPRRPGFDSETLIAVIRRESRALRIVRDRLKELNVELEALPTYLAWLDVVDLDDLTNDEADAVLQRATAEADGLILRFATENDGSPADSAE